MHRDILAHHLRWTHLAKFWSHWDTVVDVGCGRGTPLAWALYTNRCAPELYVGIDFRSLVPEKERQFLFVREENKNKSHIEIITEHLKQEGEIPNKDWMRIWDYIDATDVEEMINVQQTYGPVSAVVCLELLEHMPKEAGIRLLESLHWLAQGEPKVNVFLSTPVFNGKKAGHHVYEWEYSELRDELDRQGFNVMDHWGTFASQKDLAPVLTEEELIVFHALKWYYSADFLSIIFAPMHPAESRNVLWRLNRK